jgi:serine/threonine-protein kinase
VYSVAAVLYQLLMGAPVFTGNAAQMVSAHRDRPAPALSGHGAELAGLLERSLAKDPEQRPPDAGAFLAELEVAAQRSYGADWLRRASIAGLVAAAAGGAVTVVGSASGGPAAPTVVFDPAMAPGVGSAPAVALEKGMSTGLKLGIVGGVTTVLVAAAVVAVAVTRDEEGPPPGAAVRLAEEDARDSAQPSEEPEPTPEQTQPTGRYRGVVKLVRIVPGNGAVDDSVRRPEDEVWTFTPKGCGAASCRGTISSTTAGTFDYTWDGRRLRIPGSVIPVSLSCTFDDGSPAPGTLQARLRSEISAEAVSAKNGELTRVRVELTTRVLSYQDDPANNCSWNRPVPKYWLRGGVLRRAG